MGQNWDIDRTEAAGATASSRADMPTEVGRTNFVSAPREDKTVVRRMSNNPLSFGILAFVKGRRAGTVLTVTGAEVAIGRDAENDVVLDDEYASRRHAKIRLEADDSSPNQQVYYLWDLATANKTFVNGQEIVKHRLVEGDRIEIGETVMVYKFV